jgi:hypothetical protein
MDLQEFRNLVDATPARIGDQAQDLPALYAYVGLTGANHYARSEIEQALNARARAAFTSGIPFVDKLCRRLLTDLIREHVVLSVPLDPYFEILTHLQSATRPHPEGSGKTVEGDWQAAIEAMQDHIVISGWRTRDHERLYKREYAVAHAARLLDESGFKIRLAPGWIGLTEEGDAKLVKELERRIAQIGGLNVLRRLFGAIEPLWDPIQERHHLVPRPSMMGDTVPTPPWGYLLQLAAKHIEGRRPLKDTDANWDQLLRLATTYCAVIDVQPHTPTAFRTFEASGLIDFLRDLALYDTLFRVQQLRPSDVGRIARGMLDFVDMTASTRSGWTLSQALDVIGYLMNPARGERGPVLIEEKTVCKALPHVPAPVVSTLLAEVLSHGSAGANAKFSRPTDMPTAEDKTLGLDFGMRPLLRFGTRRFVLVDRAVAGPACLEALLTPLRLEQKGLDGGVGGSLERFLEAQLLAHGVPIRSGDYNRNKEHSECDLVVETASTLIFFELKKKALTRRARAGSDVELLLDLGASLLAAHAQAGWHEIRIQADGHLDLTRAKQTKRLELKDREVEKVAVAMLDYGSFQDRIVLKHFLETSIGACFDPVEPRYGKKFDEMNGSLEELRDQLTSRQLNGAPLDQPFFNCWFLSLPQLLIILDGVTSPEELRSSLFTARHITTGSSDFYFEHSYASKIKAPRAAMGGSMKTSG